jgi:NAD(P)H dehydrogenase (quinone)
MRCLIVLAHPLPDSLNRRLAAFVRSSLGNAGHQVHWIDLYGAEYDPRLTAEERRRHGKAEPGPIEGAEHATLADAELLVLVFPTWWFAMPAIMKGWIDRTFAPGLAFHDDGKGGPIRPGLTRLRHMLVVTTLGSPWWLARIVMREPLRRTLRLGLAKACAPQARFRMLSLYSAETADEKRITDFERRIAASLPK